MKAIFRMLKPMIKAILISQMKSQQDKIVTLLMKKIQLNMSGEEEEKVLTDIYDALEAIIKAQIEAV